MADGPLPSDLPHDPGAVAKQLAFSNVKGTFTMTGFVKAFEDEFHSSMNDPPVMGLLRPSDLPTTSALAAHYTVCDHWFACVPTSTAPNRLMSMSGTTDHSDTGLLLPNQQTVYDWLSNHRVRWRVYAAGLPFFPLMPRLAPLVLTTHFRRLGELAGDLANDPADQWPQVIFVEPDYYDCPVHFQPPCDNHAPLGMAPGEAFLAQVYRTFVGSPRWGRTVFFLTYDEHGGFFDHVPPLKVTYRNPNGVAFTSTGPRVPAIVAGAFAPRGVSRTQFDNTSILQLLAERFGAPNEAYSPQVADRARQGIASASMVLSAGAGNVAAAASGIVTVPVGTRAPPATTPNALQGTFEAGARSLLAAHQAEALAKYPELRVLLGQ